MVDCTANGELAQVQLAQQYRTRIIQPANNRRILVRHKFRQHLRPTRREHALRVYDVLDTDRDPVQRALVPARLHLRFRLPRLRHRLLAHHSDVRAKLVVESRNAL